MTHDELLSRINEDEQVAHLYGYSGHQRLLKYFNSLRAVVELHQPSPIPDWVPTEKELICWCAHIYPCPTIQAIEKVLG